jgi:hypothetical protein
MNNPPRFFLPLISKCGPKELYQQIKRRLFCPSYPLTDRRIFKLVLEHDGTIKVGRTQIEVGKKIFEGGEFIVAIFETKGWYLVATKTNGAVMGRPYYVDGQDVIQIVDFMFSVPSK